MSMTMDDGMQRVCSFEMFTVFFFFSIRAVAHLGRTEQPAFIVCPSAHLFGFCGLPQSTQESSTCGELWSTGELGQRAEVTGASDSAPAKPVTDAPVVMSCCQGGRTSSRRWSGIQLSYISSKCSCLLALIPGDSPAADVDQTCSLTAPVFPPLTSSYTPS